ncbi:MAG: hypothetical protein M3R17_04535 [Bacteroidota bacterium]|nr:hypothetical protein [Bacteroidota bacterium]
MELFKNRTAVLLTMHQKEDVIFPVLQATGMLLKVEKMYDTDLLGTFTNEIARQGSQLEAARAKALKAIEITGNSIGIASEGSFGSHPTIYFVPANIELVLLVDAENKIEIAGWELTTDTNFSGTEVTNYEEALVFAEKTGFPQHGLVVKYPAKEDGNKIAAKGIISPETLKSAIAEALKFSLDGKAHLETDMRALYNPTRMKVIEKATINLLSKIKSLCPECGCPGFEITEWIKGLPCENCFFPTRGISKHIYQCKKCNHKKEIEYPDDQKYSEARFCDFCNP